MRILWRRVFAAVLALFVCIVLFLYGHSILAFLKTMERVGPGQPPPDQTLGLLAFGLVLAGVLALTRILTAK